MHCFSEAPRMRFDAGVAQLRQALAAAVERLAEEQRAAAREALAAPAANPTAEAVA
jgi:hypothetical protein